MAAPRVFISSTWYDLRYIRENLRYFVKTLGYEPVLSEDGAIFYDPRIYVQQACITEIPNCQMFVLIVGGRYGSSFIHTDKSVTNSEYMEASKLKIPIFALVEYSVLNDFDLYTANKDRTDIDAAVISYPSADNVAIFEFIDSIRNSAVNNALVPFRDFSDIESYLRQQWAGMMSNFLTAKNEEDRVSDTLEVLKQMSARVEIISQQILESVGTKSAKLTAAFYDEMIQHECIRDMAYMGARPTPGAVIENDTFQECFESLGSELHVDSTDTDRNWVGQDGRISDIRFDSDQKAYVSLRKKLLTELEKSSMSANEYLDAISK